MLILGGVWPVHSFAHAHAGRRGSAECLWSYAIIEHARV